MYNTYLCDQNQQSIFSVFFTDLKKTELVSPAIPSTPMTLTMLAHFLNFRRNTSFFSKFVYLFNESIILYNINVYNVYHNYVIIKYVIKFLKI